MDNREARALLSLARPDVAGDSTEEIEAARQQAETDPALARWWRDDQEIDRLIAEKLGVTSVPSDLRERCLAAGRPVLSSRSLWPRRLTLVAASIILLAVFFGSWQGFFQPAVSLADYRDEMVSFVRLDPALALETSEMSKVEAYLQTHWNAGEVQIPERLQALDPTGCRVLRFRGEDVALICFRRPAGDLIHLFIIKESAFPRFRSTPENPQYAAEGEWTSAAWVSEGCVYLFAGRGGRAVVAQYLETS